MVSAWTSAPSDLKSMKPGWSSGSACGPITRWRGVGRVLVEAAEAWARAKGCSEMGSDAELWNEESHKAHLALGFTEATRLGCFSKSLRSGGGAARHRR